MVDRLIEYPERTKMQLLAPIISGKKGTHVKLLEDLKKQGYVRVRVDGEMRDLDDLIELDKNKKHDIEVVIDRIVMKEGIESTIYDSLETACNLADGRVLVDVMEQEELLFSQHHACPICGFSIGELEPRMFSFNSPFGACPSCDGLGFKQEVDLDLVIPDWSKSLEEHAIAPWEPTSSQYYPQLLKAVCDHYKIPMDVPVSEIPKEQMDKILYGSNGELIHFYYESEYGSVHNKKIEFEGVVRNIDRRFRESSSDYVKEQMAKYMNEQSCPTCKGYRLKPESLAVKVEGLNISEATQHSIQEMYGFFSTLTLTEKEMQIAKLIIREITERLSFLN